MLVDIFDQHVAKRALLADLLHGAPAPVHVIGGRAQLAGLHPAEQIRTGVEPFAVGEDFPQAGGSHWMPDKNAEEIGRPIVVAKKRQAHRIAGRRQTQKLEITQRPIVQDHEPGKVQLAELDEWNELIFRVGQSLTLGQVHGRKQFFQRIDVAVADRCGNHEARLRRHGEWTPRIRQRRCYLTPSRRHISVDRIFAALFLSRRSFHNSPNRQRAFATIKRGYGTRPCRVRAGNGSARPAPVIASIYGTLGTCSND